MSDIQQCVTNLIVLKSARLLTGPFFLWIEKLSIFDGAMPTSSIQMVPLLKAKKRLVLWLRASVNDQRIMAPHIPLW